MRTKREAHENDQKNATKADRLFEELVSFNPEIPDAIWVGVMWAHLAQAHKHSGFSFEEFSAEVDNVKNHYKYLWSTI